MMDVNANRPPRDTGGVENPAGLTKNVDELSETPAEMLRRVLLPDEQVIGNFDCFFPSFMLPRWKIVLLLISTLGLYGFVLLGRWIQRQCIKNKCYTPMLVEFQRGKVKLGLPIHKNKWFSN